MKFIVKTCAGREHYLPYLEAHLPKDTVYCFDDTGQGAVGNFLKALQIAGDDPAVHLEDDILLTRNFEEKINAVIQRHEKVAIQFFSMRKADLTVGSRWEPGRTYLMNQCHYFPASMGMDVYWHWQTLPEEWKKVHSNGTDTLVAHYLGFHGLEYWLHCPSLVDHRVGKSMIDPRRASTNRQSFTFEDPIEDI